MFWTTYSVFLFQNKQANKQTKLNYENFKNNIVIGFFNS